MVQGHGATASPLVHGQWGLQVAHHGGAGHSQHIPLASLAQCFAKPCVSTQLIVTGNPAVRHLIPLLVKHLQALLVAGVILHFWRHVACLASKLVPCPLLGKV